MSLARHFASSKKINLSSEQSEAGNNTKKMREDSSTTSFYEKNDLFLEGLKSDDSYTILANCFKNIKEKIEKLLVMARKNNKTQIKGKKTRRIQLSPCIQI